MESDFTPLEQYDSLARRLGLEKLFIKREDLNPSGSHKDRGVWGMMLGHMDEGVSNFVISSSGNSAISAAYFMQKSQNNENNKLYIYISPRMSNEKRERLDEIVNDNPNIEVRLSERAKSDAFAFAKESGFRLLRASVDDRALIGYGDLAREINNQIDGDLSYHIFIPTSSGTTALGLYKSFKTDNIGQTREISIHIAQSVACNVIAKKFDSDFTPSDTSLASAIVDTIGHRKKEVIEAVKDSNGFGWVISDDDLIKARELLESYTDICDAGWDSLLSLASLMKAMKTRNDIKNAILIFTGK